MRSPRVSWCPRRSRPPHWSSRSGDASTSKRARVGASHSMPVTPFRFVCSRRYVAADSPSRPPTSSSSSTSVSPALVRDAGIRRCGGAKRSRGATRLSARVRALSEQDAHSMLSAPSTRAQRVGSARRFACSSLRTSPVASSTSRSSTRATPGRSLLRAPCDATPRGGTGSRSCSPCSPRRRERGPRSPCDVRPRPSSLSTKEAAISFASCWNGSCSST